MAVVINQHSQGRNLRALLLWKHNALPVLLSLVLQAAASCGKERAGYRDYDRFAYHVPKQRGPNVPDEQRLLDHIMRGYERSVRPVRNASSPVVIQMGLTLTQVLDMDEKNQVLITNVWLDHEWVDEFLVWEPSKFNNITKLRIPCHKIWLPDMVLYNNAAEYTDGLMPANAMVEPNGNVFWPVPTKLQSSCKVDVTYFPFDSQECSLKFGSWTYDGYQVDITNRTSEVDLSNYIVNGEWELLYVKCVRNVVRYACCDEPFPDVTFYIKIRRRTLYYMYNVVFPCVMMSALTLLVFCLPPDSGEKIALGITVLLAFSVFMLAVAENLPETSEFVPLISIYLTIVMALTSVSVIMTVFVLNLHHRGPHKHSVPTWLKKFFLGSSEVKRRSFRRPNDRHGHLHYSGIGGMDTHCMVKNMSLKLTLDNLAQELRDELQLENGLLDYPEYHQATNANDNPPSTLADQESEIQSNFSSATANQNRHNSTANQNRHTSTASQDRHNSTANQDRNTTASNQKPKTNDTLGVGANTTSQCTNSPRKPQTHTPGAELPKPELHPHRRPRQKPRATYEEALLSLTKLLERHEVEEREYEDIQDWRRLAQSVDRILFVFFLVATVSSTLAVLVIVPATQDT
ncbi:neuronal acetylcholine receptor subunit alpha-2-like [Physella acuta]|uniref:neuronal acetylcholine receptor subunit alpha-2-like n=1 Tax=Physella acuta TaxID=109671 RepID=UPI0027DE536C|nr:neuronal acetylcholine receptor subunit alpha-2-like [Physella acuta]